MSKGPAEAAVKARRDEDRVDSPSMSDADEEMSVNMGPPLQRAYLPNSEFRRQLLLKAEAQQ